MQSNQLSKLSAVARELISHTSVTTCTFTYIHTYIDPIAIVTNDSYSHRSIPMSLRVVLNPVDVHGGLSVCDNKSHIPTYTAGRLRMSLYDTITAILYLL